MRAFQGLPVPAAPSGAQTATHAPLIVAFAPDHVDRNLVQEIGEHIVERDLADLYPLIDSIGLWVEPVSDRDDDGGRCLVYVTLRNGEKLTVGGTGSPFVIAIADALERVRSRLDRP